MNRRSVCIGIVALVLSGSLWLSGKGQSSRGDAYLSWDAGRVESIGKAMRADGRVGGFLDLRVIHTERSYNYKLRATWLTPEVIRASARLQQIRQRLSDTQTLALVTEAEGAGDTVVMIEIDPREGSGVIPLDWSTFIRAKNGNTETEVGGTVVPGLRNLKGLAGTVARDYNYDVFWAVFPLQDSGRPIFADVDREAELIVRIYGNEGRVSWQIPPSIRQRLAGVSPK